MLAEIMGPDIARSALIIIDMQNDFLHPDGSFANAARERPEANIDMPFLVGTIHYARSSMSRTCSRPITQMRRGLTGG
jgi:nicotinamidase-related amidase